MAPEQERPARDPLTEAIIGAAYEVANILGNGFLENVYRRAMTHELRWRRLDCRQEVPFPVNYKGEIVGQYIADLVVNDRVIVELKATECLVQTHISQTLNYLNASGLRLALLINFGTPRIEIRRLVR